MGPVVVQGWGRLQKNWAAQFLLSHQLTQAFSGESETAPMILNSFQTFLYYAYSSRKTQCSGRLLEHRGRKRYNFPTFYVISNDVFRLLATFWTSQSTQSMGRIHNWMSQIGFVDKFQNTWGTPRHRLPDSPWLWPLSNKEPLASDLRPEP